MMDVSKDVLYFEGLDDVIFALMTNEEGPGTEPEYGELWQLPIATKLGIKGNGSTLEKFASSKLFRAISRETKHEIGLDHVGIPIDYWDQLIGAAVELGVSFGKTQARQYPFFGFGFIGNIEGGGKKAVWYPKCQISNVIDESYETAENEPKINDVTANLVAYGLNFNQVMYSSFDSNRDSATGIDWKKFIDQPVYDETQWKTLATPTGGGGGQG